MDTQINSALKQSRQQLKETADTQGNSLKLRMVDGVPIAPDHVKAVMEAFDQSNVQFTAFQTVKEAIADYLGSAAILPVSSGALALEETNIFTTNAVDQALQSLPHSLPNLIQASVLTLVEERRVDAVHHMCGAQLQLLVVSAKRSGRKQHVASHKRPAVHGKSKDGSMMGQGRSSGRMPPAAQGQGRSGFLAARQDRTPGISEELDAMLARKSYLGKADAEADQLLMQPSAMQSTQRQTQGHGPRTRQYQQSGGGGGFLNKR